MRNILIPVAIIFSLISTRITTINVTISFLFARPSPNDTVQPDDVECGVQIGYEIGMRRIQELLDPFNVTVNKAYRYAGTNLQTMQHAIDLSENVPNLIASIGQKLTSLCVEQAVYFSSLPRPVISISPSSGGPKLDKKQNYPYFFRTLATNRVEMKALSAFISNYWKNIGVLYVEDIYPISNIEPPLIVQESFAIDSKADQTAQIRTGLTKIKDSGVKVIFLGVFDYKIVYEGAVELGMINDEFIFIGTNIYQKNNDSFFGLIFDNIYFETENPTPEYLYLEEAWTRQVSNDPTSVFYDSRPPPAQKPNIYGMASYDAVIGLGHAMVHALQNNVSVLDTVTLAEYLRNLTYTGSLMYQKGFNEDQDGKADFSMFQDVGIDQPFNLIGRYNITSNHFQVNEGVPIYFGNSPNASLTPPSDGSNPSTKNTVALGIGLTQAAAGKRNIIDLKIKNSFRNRVAVNETEITLELSKENNKIDLQYNVTFTGVTGEFEVGYNVPTYGTYLLSIFLQGNHIKDSPFVINGIIECNPQCDRTGLCQSDGTCACEAGYTGKNCGELFPLTTFGITTVTGIIVLAFGALNVVLVIGSLTLIYIFRNEKVIRVASLNFIMTIGGVLSFTTTIPCWIAPICFHVGFTISFITLLIKNLRIVMVYSGNLKKSTMRSAPLYISGIVSLVAVVIIISQLTHPSTVVIVNYSNSRILECTDSLNPWQILLYAVEVIILLSNAFISFKSRQIADIYSESKTIAISTYTVFMLILVYYFMIHNGFMYIIKFNASVLVHIAAPMISTLTILTWKIYGVYFVVATAHIKKSSCDDSILSNSAVNNAEVVTGLKVEGGFEFEFKGKKLGISGLFRPNLHKIVVKVLVSRKIVTFIHEDSRYCWSINLNACKKEKFWQVVYDENEEIKGVIITGAESSFWLQGNPILIEELRNILYQMFNKTGSSIQKTKTDV
ncbi:hypothetical protein HK099_004999 [Clydaea vesicula]|uniref:G-protein coupled receptors family 3 profile domain-containing protein n=1 Tax=Clydaea vesicula TaxID=447962 RepID=A0AAD5TZU7_9FUNG|nr:hypothetical protein HK099_004999 [Clydaea vesicula]